MKHAIAFALIGGAVAAVYFVASERVHMQGDIERLERERVIDDAGQGVNADNWRDKLRDGD